MRWLIWKLLRKHKNPTLRNTVEVSKSPTPKSGTAEWKHVLTASLELNSMAPSDDVVLHAFDLFRDDLYGPCAERVHQMADLYAEISADVAALRALAPELIDRAMTRHPYEFAHIIDHKEDF